MKKSIACLVLAALLLITSCTWKEKGNADMDVRRERQRKAMYFEEMYFRSSIYHRRAYWPDTASEYSDFVLVHSEAEASEYPDDVIVGWPSDITPKIVDELNAEILLAEIDLEPFSLEYPITIENVVEDWEKVRDLWWNALSSSDREYIKRNASGFFEWFFAQNEAREAAEATGG